MKKGRMDGGQPSKPNAQRRLIDFSFIVNHIKHFALRSAVRLLDGMIWFLDVLIALRGDDHHSDEWDALVGRR